MIPDHPLFDVAVAALIAAVVLLVTPGVAITGIVGVLILLAVGVQAIRAQRRHRPGERRVRAIGRGRRL